MVNIDREIDQEVACLLAAKDAEIKRLREALEPFAKRAELLDHYYGVMPDALVRFGVYAKDCVAARSALRPTEAGNG